MSTETYDSPKPGDVVFVQSSSIPSLVSGLAQRLSLKTKNPDGPRFSHVAIVLNDKVAFEASPLPHTTRHTVWSGSPHVVSVRKEDIEFDPHFEALLNSVPAENRSKNSRKVEPSSRIKGSDPSSQVTPKSDPPKWNRGARLILLPDLLIPAKRKVILRHRQWENVPQSEFDTASIHIAALYGSEYSIKRLKVSFESTVPMLAKSLPKAFYKKVMKEAAAPSDEFATILHGDKKFQREVENALSAGSFTNTFFCSQLVAAMLVHAKLLRDCPELADITPCGLFDLLQGHWEDVTDAAYGHTTIDTWKNSSKVNWQTEYYLAVGRAVFFRNHHLTMGALDVVQRKMDEDNASLVAIMKKLNSEDGWPGL